MNGRAVGRRERRGKSKTARVLLVVAAIALCAWGCAAGSGGRPDASGGGMDGSSAPMDAQTMPDTGPIIEDSGTDAGPPVYAGTCEACSEHADCGPGSFCAMLTGGEKACVPGCVPDLPDCPRAFNCVIDFTTGVSSAICVPVGELCCVDEDADAYGQGIGCSGPDCDDDDATRNAGASEVCNGVDDNCDGSADNPPTDCATGRCTDDGDGTYTGETGGTCVDAECESGTTSDCGLYTCEDGADRGDVCATLCNPEGADDDMYCIEAAHCDGGACVDDQPNGGTCDEDGDCAAGHCDNGFCCDGGTCCATTADCPGGGAVAAICDSPSTCQGTRGETTCMDNTCRTMSGIPDDSACTTSTRALDCTTFDPVYCDGTADQTPPECPTSCIGDDECVDAAHCDSGFCIPDRPLGMGCSRPADCQDGLFCADGVCCGSPCLGTCMACNLPGMAGTCAPVPAMADPAGECPGFSCASYYDGFSGGGDVCYQRQNVPDSLAACNGAGACIDPGTLCSFQPRGAVQVDCDNTCQSPVSGTCTGTTPGACRDLDSPGDTTSCGMGSCRTTVQRCVGGRPNSCTAGSPMVESCNGMDDDCDGVPDDGSGAALCPPAANVSSYTCSGGSCSFMCQSSWYNVDGSYSTGCECHDTDSGSTSCSTATGVGTVGSAMTVSGTLVSGEETADWFSVNFPMSSRGSSNGTPTIAVSSGRVVLDVYIGSCSMNASCGTEGGTARGTVSYSFTDNQSTAGPRQWSENDTPWPSTAIFGVRPASGATGCIPYTITISR